MVLDAAGEAKVLTVLYTRGFLRPPPWCRLEKAKERKKSRRRRGIKRGWIGNIF